MKDDLPLPVALVDKIPQALTAVFTIVPYDAYLQPVQAYLLQYGPCQPRLEVEESRNKHLLPEQDAVMGDIDDDIQKGLFRIYDMIQLSDLRTGMGGAFMYFKLHRLLPGIPLSLLI